MELFTIKRLTIFIHDLLWIPVAVLLAFWFRFNLGDIPTSNYYSMLTLAVVASPLHGLTFWFFGAYRGIWKFASLSDLLRILQAILVGTIAVSAALFVYSRFEGIPRSVIILYPILLFIGVSTSRVAYRMLRTHHVSLDKQDREHALIVGAGRAANLLIRDLLENGPFLPVGLIDDHPAKQGTDLHGIRVVGKVADLPALIQSMGVKTVLIAMPSAARSVMDEIIRTCAERKVACRTLPSLLELADGRVEVSRLRPVTVEDLLGREPVKLDINSINAYLTGNCVAVTGGGGSIGSELCRQILTHKPKTLLIIESSEYNLYSIDLELRQKCPECDIRPLLIDIRVRAAVEKVFSQFSPNVVFHAAAYKHVPMVEENIVEGVRNNILGTKTVADAAVKYGVTTFVQVSTDKTVNPTSVMGASKRVAEVYCQSLNSQVDTHIVTTRFGNVLGSTGSVVPLFERQIQKGGPVTVTHPDITRYFMTIPEAASLILQAGAMGQGGEIYVLDMGSPVKITDLAENMIRLCGLEPEVDIEIEFIGLRPGEKLHEELFYNKEELMGTGHPKLMLAHCITSLWDSVKIELDKLQNAVEVFDESTALNIVQQLVPEYRQLSSRPKADVVPLIPRENLTESAS